MTAIERTAVPLKCRICGNDIASPGTYMASVTHDPNEGEYFHTHCWKARQAPPVPAEVGELVKLLVEGVGREFDGELHLTEDDAFKIARALERYAAALVEIAAKTDVNCDEAATVARTALQTNP